MPTMNEDIPLYKRTTAEEALGNEIAPLIRAFEERERKHVWGISIGRDDTDSVARVGILCSPLTAPEAT